MNSVGETLRRERVKQGLDLAEVAARTKINSKHLDSIESDDRKSLPAAFFYRNWVHQYARALSLDTRLFDAELDRVLGCEEPPPLPGQDAYPIRAREPEIQVRESRFQRRPLFWSLGLLSMLVLGCAGLYGWWNKTVHARVAPGAAAISSVSSPAPQRLAQYPPSQSDRLVVSFVAIEETWLEVTSDGKLVFTGVLQPNQAKSVEGKQVATLTVGNAGGLEVRLNGKVIGPLGPHGQVRTVVFTHNKFQIVPKDGAS